MESVECEPIVDTSSNFRLGDRHYLARPTGFKRHRPYIVIGKSDEAQLATFFRVENNQC